MDINDIPITFLLIVTFVLVLLSIEFGYRIGAMIRKKQEVESESAASSVSGYVLALLAFIVAFTFGIVTDRYQTRKDLVREEANLIRTAWERADFLPDSISGQTKSNIARYAQMRLDAVKSRDLEKVKQAITEGTQIRENLWDDAVRLAKIDMNSDVAALYIESVNSLSDINASRVVVGLHTRIPEGIWEMLFILVLLGMFSVGYQMAIAGSKRSWSTLLMAISFSIVIVMIEVLDRPTSNLIPVSQFPMEYLLQEIGTVK